MKIPGFGPTPVRILPLMMAAAAALLLLKGIGLLTQGRFVLTGTTSAIASGAAPAPAAPAAGAAKPGEEPPPGKPKVNLADPASPKIINPAALPSSENSVLEKLADRREQLDQRSRDLDTREALLKAAEKRLNDRINELAALEDRLKERAATMEKQRSAELKAVVTMYESMKPTDAARILDKLDMAVVVDIARQMKPPKMAPIVASLSPDVAQKLTAELARTDGQDPNADIKSLPKIGEAQPSK